MEKVRRKKKTSAVPEATVKAPTAATLAAIYPAPFAAPVHFLTRWGNVFANVQVH